MTVALPARAKLNLDLHVVRKLPDGFHDLDTTMQAIDLHDVIVISPSERSSLTITGFEVAGGAENNSVLKAQRELEAAVRRPLPADFELHKRIPPGSGMGGASSDAASALRGLASAYGLTVDLGPIAERVGADVPFFLHGGRMKARGRGERLTVEQVRQSWFAIAWPGIELSTAAVYRAWDEIDGTNDTEPNQLTSAAEHVDRRVGEFARRLGSDWQMTGSGSAFFKRCEGEAEARHVISALDCWSAAAQSIGAWA